MTGQGGNRAKRLFASELKSARLGAPAGLIAFYIGASHVGFVPAVLASFLASGASFLRQDADSLWMEDCGVERNTEHLTKLSERLAEERGRRLWRNERLAVRALSEALTPGTGPVLGFIERGCARPLGIGTSVVRLLLKNADGTFWVARRSAAKATNPGKLDNLAAGMVSGDETLSAALFRESREEAGLDLTNWPLRLAASYMLSRPIPEGWLLEASYVYEVSPPVSVTPRNLDGEVSEFLLLTEDEILSAIEKGDFTQEAALAFLGSFAR